MVSSSGFEIRWWWLHKVSLGVFFLLQLFGKVLEGWVYVPLWMFGRIHLRSHLILDFWCRECFYDILSFTSNDRSVHQGLFLLDSVLVSYNSLKSCPFLLGCQVCWHIIYHTILLWFFVFLHITAKSWNQIRYSPKGE